MSTIINFKIEKLLTPAKELSGYFVIATDGDASSNPLAGIMKMFGENAGEQWKDGQKPEQKLFFKTEKEVADFISYQLDEFKDKN